MPAVAPEPGSADAAAVGGVAFEGGELRVGQGFARQGEQPEGGAGVFERVQGGRAIERDEQKCGAEHDDRERLHLEKGEHLGGEVGGPVDAQLAVAGILGRVVADHADRKVGAQPHAPRQRERRDQRSADGPAGSGPGVKKRQGAKRIRPREVDDAVVLDPAGDEIEHGECTAQRGQSGKGEDRCRHRRRADFVTPMRPRFRRPPRGSTRGGSRRPGVASGDRRARYRAAPGRGARGNRWPLRYYRAA